ncbi:HAD family phosphatase [Panacibacter ginsenosidivorans]|uniref:HAD family phosphatase n=1 Tax=Panacibacter ginsenosidivorans TaxID=1813871 RepID=A0A5B8VC06_9BACT|nr:HAD family phosphatase [Panacibacter ginsenosidivorans]QEC68216.1 HAD family phosphatase [Panacibacter ginsenosidivorans]
MQQFKNIIFDLGGIFLNIDFAKTEKAFTDLGITNFNSFFTQHHASDLFEKLETGHVSPEEFCTAFRKETGMQLSDEQIITAWNALLLDFPVERIHWLQQINKRYKVFLFSNTNKIHYDAFVVSFFEQTGLTDFNSNFIKAYYSHEIGLRKPYPESFQYIIDEQNLQPTETLFIDDTFKNIEGAKAVGLQTIHLTHPKTVLELEL